MAGGRRQGYVGGYPSASRPCIQAAAATSPQAVDTHDPPAAPTDGAPRATRRDLQLGRRLFHLVNGVTIATAYALLFTHEQVVQIFAVVACTVYIVDRVRIAYPEAVARYAPWVNRSFVRAEEQVRESAMTPFAIAVLLTILAVPKLAALVAIYTLAVADPLAAVVGIRFGRRRIARNRSLEGSLAFFAATVAIAVLVLRWGTDASPLTIAETATTIAVAAAACELLPLRIDDNLTIPIFVGFATWTITWLFGTPLT
jgi:dolichol kinase